MPKIKKDYLKWNDYICSNLDEFRNEYFYDIIIL